MGWGFGLSTSYLYNADQSGALKSQLNFGGQYSVTDSYTVFVRNNLWLRNNSYLSSSNFAYSSINNKFENDRVDVAYHINTLLLAELLMFRVAGDFYIGTPLTYKKLSYSPINDAGEDFIIDNGIIDEKTGGIGVAVSYDTRRNKYYPSNSVWISARINDNPEWLGAINTYYSTIIDARYYAEGFGEDDVWAW
jgi:hypothetical protein